jgi:hypothetical protein
VNVVALQEIIESVVANASPLEGNSIEDGERVTYGAVVGADVGPRVDAIDWSDSVVERSRLAGTTVSNSSFERVVFHDCDFSGMTFANCLLRDCLIVGVKSNSHLTLDNCILDGLTFARIRTDRFEIHNCRIGSLNCVEVTSAQLVFHHCNSHKRYGRISFSDSDLAKVVGLDTLGESGINVVVDAALWRDLGDYLLRERGIEELDRSSILSTDSLDRIAQYLDRRRL